jgi:2,4-dienoyl-CoA reductase-like NADH-dependent reductase (Old Yellow Enzyme family)
MLEAVDAAISVWGADRVGLHLSPRGDVYESDTKGDSDPAATFGYVAREMARRKIAFICARESLEDPRQGPMIKQTFGGVFIANQKLTKETGNDLLAKGEADAIAYGQLFIANPDLPLRFAKDAPLNMPDPETFYSEGTVGYTDYPFLT